MQHKKSANKCLCKQKKTSCCICSLTIKIIHKFILLFDLDTSKTLKAWNYPQVGCNWHFRANAAKLMAENFIQLILPVNIFVDWSFCAFKSFLSSINSNFLNSKQPQYIQFFYIMIIFHTCSPYIVMSRH